MEEEKTIGRQGFMKGVIAVIGGLITAGMGIPAVAYILGPVLNRTEQQDWIRLGSASNVEPGIPTLFKARIEQQAGWIVSEEEKSVYVLTDDGRTFIAMSNICTHLGCRVRWIEDQSQFFCPCHNAVFDREGDVVSGPPPRPLDRFQVKVEDEQLYILGG